MRTSYDTAEIITLLGLPDYDDRLVGRIVKTDQRFIDAHCDRCKQAAAVNVDYTVSDEEGYVATDAAYCTEHAGEEIRLLTDFDVPASPDHDIEVTVNYWAIRYGEFKRVTEKAAA